MLNRHAGPANRDLMIPRSTVDSSAHKWGSGQSSLVVYVSSFASVRTGFGKTHSLRAIIGKINRTRSELIIIINR